MDVIELHVQHATKVFVGKMINKIYHVWKFLTQHQNVMNIYQKNMEVIGDIYNNFLLINIYTIIQYKHIYRNLKLLNVL